MGIILLVTEQSLRQGDFLRVESYRADIPEPVIDQVADIYIECFTGPPRFEEWSVEKVKAHLRKLLTGEADLYVVVEGDSDVVSFGIGLAMADYFNAEELIEHGANPESYYFAELATRERARGKGYGATLQKRRELAAIERGHACLSVRVRSDNEITIKLLNRAGFQQVGKYEAAIQGSHTERILLEKKLDPEVS